jgi:hypothetical protein
MDRKEKELHENECAIKLQMANLAETHKHR